MGRIRARFNDPDGDRYGLPTFWWKGAPDGYATVRQLRARGLRPGGQDVAAEVRWMGVGGERVAYLYRVADAKPKRTATPRQLEAIAKALVARRTCRTCGIVRDYYIRTSLDECFECIEARHKRSDQHGKAA
jgi:hypothetical protein